MSGRGLGALSTGAVLIAALSFVAAPPAPAQTPETCPPVTMDVLFPPSTTTTTTPTTTTTTTTIPTTTTTTSLPETTTTLSDSSTTTTAPTSTTTTMVETTTVPPTTTTTTPPLPPCEPFVYDMAWPLAGEGQIGSPFGADRDGGARKHMGNDIAAPKLTPVVAVADGVLIRVAAEVGTANCCWAIVQHHDGWQSYYIHLNNDTYGTDDGHGLGVRPDLVEGSEVRRGEVIGWVGDSGNAEETVDHLHFELRNPEGLAVDPRPSLTAARSAASIPEPQPRWPFADDDGHYGEGAAAWLLTRGLLLDCDGTWMHLCPDQIADAELAATVGRHLADKPVPPIATRSQPLPDDMPVVDPVSLGPALQCNDTGQCRLEGLSETEAARLAVWIRIDAMIRPLRPSPLPEGSLDVLLPGAEEAEARLRDIGGLGACNAPLRGDRLLTRAEAIAHLVAWAQGTNPRPCEPDQPTN